MSSKFLKIGLCALSVCAISATSCKKDGGSSSKRKSQRARWVDSPSSGKAEGDTIVIEGLGVHFTKPEVLYVYKECMEASHSPEGPDKDWIPVIRCETEVSDDTDEFADDGKESAVLTIYAAHKTSVINERTVESFRASYQNAGYVVDDINFVEDYMSKPGRRGIETKAHLMDSSTGYPAREIQRFLFPVGDVIFIMHIDYPYGDDRSGINNDWQRIFWNFELSEERDVETTSTAPEADESE